MKLPLHHLALFVNNPQILKIQGSIFVENLQNKPGPHVGVEIPDAPVHKGGQHRRLLQAHGYHHLFRHNNAERDGHIPVFAAALLNGGNIHQYQGIIVLCLNTGALLLIQRRSQMVRVYIVSFRDLQYLRGRRICKRHPTAVLYFIFLMDRVVLCHKDLNHSLTLFQSTSLSIISLTLPL